MKKLISILLVFLSFSSFAQTKIGHTFYSDLFNTMQYGRQAMWRTDHINVDTLTDVISGTVAYDTLNDVMIVYDGSSWTDVGSGGASEWTRNGSILTPNNLSDTIGIGLVDPDAKLTVYGSLMQMNLNDVSGIISDTNTFMFGVEVTAMVAFTDSSQAISGIFNDEGWGTVDFTMTDTLFMASTQRPQGRQEGLEWNYSSSLPWGESIRNMISTNGFELEHSAFGSSSYQDARISSDVDTTASRIDITAQTVSLSGETLELTGDSVFVNTTTPSEDSFLRGDAFGRCRWDYSVYGEMGFGDSLSTQSLAQNVETVITNLNGDLWSVGAVTIYNIDVYKDLFEVKYDGTYEITLMVSGEGKAGSILELGVLVDGAESCFCTGRQETSNQRIVNISYQDLLFLNQGQILQPFIMNTANNDDFDAISGKMIVRKL